MRGFIPFEASFRLRSRILREIPVSRVRDIVASIPLDHALEAFLRENRDHCNIVTGNLDVWVSGLLDRIGCRYFASTGIVRDDRLEEVSYIMRKDAPIRAIRSYGYTRVAAIGDGFNDIPMLQTADIGIAFGGVHPPVPEVVELADYVAFGGESLCRLLNTL